MIGALLKQVDSKRRRLNFEIEEDSSTVFKAILYLLSKHKYRMGSDQSLKCQSLLADKMNLIAGSFLTLIRVRREGVKGSMSYPTTRIVLC